jgi:hypothetical protein
MGVQSPGAVLQLVLNEYGRVISGIVSTHGTVLGAPWRAGAPNRLSYYWHAASCDSNICALAVAKEGLDGLHGRCVPVDLTTRPKPSNIAPFTYPIPFLSA